MTGAFEVQKKQALNKFLASVRVGDVDEPLLPLLELINSRREYYTTSSCAGRITVAEQAGEKREHRFLGKWHRRVTPEEVLSTLSPSKGLVWFLYEPPIIHVACASIQAAEKFFKAAYACGFKRSGMQTFKEGRFLLEILSTERVDAPVMSEGERLVSEGYLAFLVEIANKKLAESQRKIRLLEVKFSLF
ncbi:MAG: hypothetical protein ABH851_02430 [Methanobacteriota archaeon]